MCASRSRRALAGVSTPASSMSSVWTSQLTMTSALTGDGPDRAALDLVQTMMWNRSSPMAKS